MDRLNAVTERLFQPEIYNSSLLHKLYFECIGDAPTSPSGVLIVLDMYEHAYKADFGGDPGKYVDGFAQMIRWVTPERLYREAIRV